MKIYSTEEVVGIANKHMKCYSTSPNIWEIKIKSKMRFHYTPVTGHKIENNGNTNVGKKTYKLDLSYSAGGM